MILHGGLIALFEAGVWRGVLIRGASGAGKSDLMLRAQAAGWRLTADDRVRVWASGGRLFGRAPDPLRDLMEVRGLGVLPSPTLAWAEINLVVDCVAVQAVERLPHPDRDVILDRPVPRVRLYALEASAPAKLRCALTRLGLTAQPSYLARGAGGD